MLRVSGLGNVSGASCRRVVRHVTHFSLFPCIRYKMLEVSPVSQWQLL